MTNIREILQDYLFFGVIFAIFLVIFIIFLLIFTNKDNKRNVYFYGLLMDLKNTEIFALSLIIINYLLLVYTLVMKLELSYALAIVSMLMIGFAYIIIKGFKYLVINIPINAVNLGIIYLAVLVNTLRLGEDSKVFYILQIALNIFGILFYTFTTLKFIKNLKSKRRVK